MSTSSDPEPARAVPLRRLTSGPLERARAARLYEAFDRSLGYRYHLGEAPGFEYASASCLALTGYAQEAAAYRSVPLLSRWFGTNRLLPFAVYSLVVGSAFAVRFALGVRIPAAWRIAVHALGSYGVARSRASAESTRCRYASRRHVRANARDERREVDQLGDRPAISKSASAVAMG